MDSNHESNLIVLVAGPSCSGKTSVCKLIKKEIGEDCIVISQDCYFKGGGTDTNYDVPDALDFEQLISDVQNIKKGNTVKIPVYDFSTHSRLKETIKIVPTKVVIVEGTQVLSNLKLVNEANIKVYIQSDSNDRFQRRLTRDTLERGYDEEEIIKRYQEHVVPSNKIIVEPSVVNASMTLCDNCDFTYTNFDFLLSEINKGRNFVHILTNIIPT
jgi:uridine kinase